MKIGSNDQILKVANSEAKHQQKKSMTKLKDHSKRLSMGEVCNKCHWYKAPTAKLAQTIMKTDTLGIKKCRNVELLNTAY